MNLSLRTLAHLTDWQTEMWGLWRGLGLDRQFPKIFIAGTGFFEFFFREGIPEPIFFVFFFQFSFPVPIFSVPKNRKCIPKWFLKLLKKLNKILNEIWKYLVIWAKIKYFSRFYAKITQKILCKFSFFGKKSAMRIFAHYFHAISEGQIRRHCRVGCLCRQCRFLSKCRCRPIPIWIRCGTNESHKSKRQLKKILVLWPGTSLGSNSFVLGDFRCGEPNVKTAIEYFFSEEYA